MKVVHISKLINVRKGLGLALIVTGSNQSKLLLYVLNDIRPSGQVPEEPRESRRRGIAYCEQEVNENVREGIHPSDSHLPQVVRQKKSSFPGIDLLLLLDLTEVSTHS